MLLNQNEHRGRYNVSDACPGCLQGIRIQYVDFGFSERIALWEFFLDTFGDNFTSGSNGDRNCQLNIVVLKLILLPLNTITEQPMSLFSQLTGFTTVKFMQNFTNKGNIARKCQR